MMLLDLPYPDKVLWPNGRGHHMAVARAKKSHKAWAYAAVRANDRAAIWRNVCGRRIQLHATFHPKTRHAVDRDNASASLKAYQDGIAAALGIDDSTFLEPAIYFAEPVKGGKVVIEVRAVEI